MRRTCQEWKGSGTPSSSSLWESTAAEFYAGILCRMDGRSSLVEEPRMVLEGATICGAL